MHQTSSTCHTLSTENLKKTTLAMSIALGLGGISTQACAGLTSSATLSFTLGTKQTVACNYGTTPPCNKASYATTDVIGSYFSMDTNSNGVEASEKTPIGSLNGIVLGTIQAASGSHSGPINGSEVPNIDAPWTFFGGTGMHQTTSPVTITGGSGGTVDMSGWNVTWNGIASIPLIQSSASISCSTASCSNTSTYTLDGAFHVNGAGFTTVAYTVHLEGSVSTPGGVPVAVNDSAKTIIDNAITIDVLANDPVAADPVDFVEIDTPPTSGMAAVNASDDTVTYTPNATYMGPDSFVYKSHNVNGYSLTPPAGNVGEQGIVVVDVQTNVAPKTNVDLKNDLVSANTVQLENAINLNGGIIVNVLANDDDVNNAQGLPGGIDPATVTIMSQPAIGTCTANANGTVTYSQPLPAVAVTSTCTYTVSDIDNSATPALVSDIGTIAINIQGIQSDWPTALPADIIPFLLFNPGVQNSAGDSTQPPASGSYFTMDVSATTTIHVLLEPGPDGGFVIGYNQLAGLSHGGPPFAGNTEPTSFDLGWNFFGNTGFTFTKNGGIVGNPDGTLEFKGDPAINNGQGRYIITWNAIPAIDLGGSSAFPEDLGFATINCNPAPCDDSSTFDLTYDAHVPPGDPSGFGGVQYGLRMTGKVSFLDSTFQLSGGGGSGSFMVSDRLTPDDLALQGIETDTDMQLQCVGGCFDFTVTGVTAGSSVDVVIPLAGGIPNDSVDGSGNPVTPELRLYKNGAWTTFVTNAMDSATTDTVESAAMVAGGPVGMQCPDATQAGWGPLTAGHQCLKVSITDNTGANQSVAPNDLNPAPGTIDDPNGIGLPAGAPIVDTRTSGHSGCSVSQEATTPLNGGAWWLLAGLAGWLGWSRRNSK